MRTVGVRELKNRLSEYLHLVRAGEEILVTDRDEVIAEITLPRTLSSFEKKHPRLAALIREGKATGGGRNAASLYPRMKRLLRTHTAAELLDESREER